MTGLRTSQVAAAAGVNTQTLRYYERRGLLAEPERSPGGHRLYPAEAVTALRIIKAAQRLGFTLDEVAELLEAGRHRHRTDAGLQARAHTKLAEIDARLADLRTIRATLLEAIDAGCDDLVACAECPSCPLPFTDLADAPVPAGPVPGAPVPGAAAPGGPVPGGPVPGGPVLGGPPRTGPGRCAECSR